VPASGCASCSTRWPARRRPVPCSDLSLRLAEVADDAVPMGGAEAEHVAACLRCQAELAQYRKLLRSLRALRATPLTPDEDLLADLLEVLRPPAPVHRLHRRNRRAAYLGGIAAATAGAAGALVLASRKAAAS
jgi:hypothetical protein